MITAHVLQNESISCKVREAIRKEKLEREYLRRQVDILGEVRQEKRQQAQNVHRFKLQS